MNTITPETATRYCTLYRIGYWGSLDAECETKPDSHGHPLIDHNVTFHMVNRFGDRCSMGNSILVGNPDGPDVFDENGETFPNLPAAIHKHAGRLLKLTAMPGLWTDAPARYETWQGTVATAFDAGERR